MFIFRTYKIKILLKLGNVLMFNPSILHSCSNPKYEGSYIMLAYVSTKTVLTSTPLYNNIKDKFEIQMSCLLTRSLSEYNACIPSLMLNLTYLTRPFSPKIRAQIEEVPIVDLSQNVQVHTQTYDL